MSHSSLRGDWLYMAPSNSSLPHSVCLPPIWRSILQADQVALSTQSHPPPPHKRKADRRRFQVRRGVFLCAFFPPTSPVNHAGNVGHSVRSHPAADVCGLHHPGGREECQRGGKIREFHGGRAVAVHHFTVQPQDQALESLQRRKCVTERECGGWMRADEQTLPCLLHLSHKLASFCGFTANHIHTTRINK